MILSITSQTSTLRLTTSIRSSLLDSVLFQSDNPFVFVSTLHNPCTFSGFHRTTSVTCTRCADHTGGARIATTTTLRIILVPTPSTGTSRRTATAMASSVRYSIKLLTCSLSANLSRSTSVIIPLDLTQSTGADPETGVPYEQTYCGSNLVLRMYHRGFLMSGLTNPSSANCVHPSWFWRSSVI